jgi:hypothetical protein
MNANFTLRPRSFFLRLALAALITNHFLLITSPAAPAKRPNILLIYADDQSYKTVGCYPESWPWVKTPNIDRLAASGVRFYAAYLVATFIAHAGVKLPWATNSTT